MTHVAKLDSKTEPVRRPLVPANDRQVGVVEGVKPDQLVFGLGQYPGGRPARRPTGSKASLDDDAIELAVSVLFERAKPDIANALTRHFDPLLSG